MSFSNCLRANLPQVRANLVGQHLLKPQAKEVRCVAAVRPRDNVASRTGRAAWPAATSGTTVGQPHAQRQISVDIADAVINQRPLPLAAQELALEQLSTAANRPKRIAGDDE